MLKDDRDLEPAAFLFLFGEDEKPCMRHNITRRTVLETFFVNSTNTLLYMHKQRRKGTI